MKKISIVGIFAYSQIMAIGATVKTKELYKELARKYGEDSVRTVDTYNWKAHKVRIAFGITWSLITCKNIILIMSHGSQCKISLYIKIINTVLKRRIHYIVVGGDLPQILESNPKSIRQLQKIYMIYVETVTMKNMMTHLGVNNVTVMNNFKNLTSLSNQNIHLNDTIPYKLCIFSRVTEGKGILDAINVVKKINETSDKIICKLDIYGQIDPDFHENFTKMVSKYSAYVTYCGVAQPENSVRILASYYLLLFPTRFICEGLPGTILDAYASGLPIVSSRWKYCFDIIEEGITGLTYDFCNIDDFYRVLNNALLSPDLINNMRFDCLDKARMYTPEESIKVICNKLE